MSHQTHPFINIVCKTLNDIQELLIIDPPKALLTLNLLLRAVDPKKRETSKDYYRVSLEVKDLIRKRAAVWSPSPEKYDRLRSEFDHTNIGAYVDLYDRAWGIMWECGYMFDSTFRVEIKQDEPIG